MEVRLQDGFLATALQMFEGCGMDGSGLLPVDTLMNNFTPYVPSDKNEYSELRSLLDPEGSNPRIGAAELAAALEKYSERQHSRADFDDSINLRNGYTPLDSDSGISTDLGYQLLEELQGERRQALRRMQQRLDAAERQHEEALVAVAAERDSLRAHLQLMREENAALVAVRKECEEASERLVAAEAAAEERARQLDAARRKLAALQRALDKMESEKSTLQTLLEKSKEECHRINDMYAARQAALLEENENFRSDYADLSSRFQEQEECLQQTLKEKVLLEMEMSDMLNRTRPADAARTAFDRSVDVSYTDAQLLRTLDTMHSEVELEENISQDEFYISDSKCERGRPSLFDELINVNSLRSKQICDDPEERSFEEATTQTEDTKSASLDAPETCNCTPRDEKICPGCIDKFNRISVLESKIASSEKTIKDMHVDLTHYENNLAVLQSNFECGEEKNRRNQSLIELLKKKLDSIDAGYKAQTMMVEKKKVEVRFVDSRKICDSVASVATQASETCAACVSRGAGGLRPYLWDAARGLLQLLALLCLGAALLALYNVSHYSYASRRCVSPPRQLPWRWLAVEDLVNFLFRIEYVGEIPM